MGAAASRRSGLGRPSVPRKTVCRSSLRLAAAHAFENGLVRIQAECETDNEASMRSMLAAGMRHEGTLRAYFIGDNGLPIDLHVLGMLPEDLAGAQPFSRR